jgi:hypothetical protein
MPLAVATLLMAGLLAVPTSQASAHGSSHDMASGAAVHEGTPAAVRIPGNLGWYSSNWAGYAVGGGPYRSVSGAWTVPTVSASGRAGFSALWVGVDGFSNASLIQAGTEADFYNGAAHYSAWWEILPAPAVTIRTLPVRAGDLVSVTITRVSSGRWRITVRDARSGTFTTTRPYAGPGTSAEWIEEAPLIASRATPLAVHGTVVFDNATVNGGSPHLVTDNGGAMIKRGVLVDAPSGPNADGNGFALAQLATPPAQPAALGHP